MADVDDTLPEWSSTSASNKPTGATTIGTNLDDNLREVQGVVTRWLSHKGADIASAGTTDIGAVDGLMHDITGAATVTGLGTIRAGIWKVLKFEGAALLTHNATSLILPGGANIITADGDVGIFISEGSGNWRCLSYSPAAARPPYAGTTSSTFTFDGSGGSSGSLSLVWRRNGNFVTLQIPTAQATTGTGSASLSSNTALPVEVRPSVTQYQSSVIITDNGAAIGASGVISVTTAGIVTINRDGAGTAFTNSATGGTGAPTSITYYAG
jgi:hypothetical protein